MRRLDYLRDLLALLALLVLPTACGSSDGTFVWIDFAGSAPGTIDSIQVEFTFTGAGVADGGVAEATFHKPASATGIALPTSGRLEIRSGEGAFRIVAKAQDGGGAILATGSGVGIVERNKTVKVRLTFGSHPDGGLDAAQPVDSPVGGDTAPGDTGQAESGDSQNPIDARQGMPDGAVDAPQVDAPVDAGGAGGVTATGGVPGSGGINPGGATATGGLPLATGGDPATTGGTLVVPSGGTVATGGIADPDAGVATGGVMAPDTKLPSYSLVVDPPARDFGIVPPGSASPALAFTLTNTGDAPSPALVAATSSLPAIFAVEADACAGKTLAPLATCTVSYTFRPTAPGSAEATGTVATTDGSSVPFTLTGAGTSAVASLAFTASAVSFGTVDVGKNATREFTLRNIGSANADAITIAITGSTLFAIAADTCSSQPLAAGAQCSITVVYTPTAYGAATGTLAASSAAGLTASATATGTGRDFLDMSLTFSGTGEGKVTGGGVTCTSPTPCTIKVPRTAEFGTMTLTATGNPGSYLSAWSGACTGQGTCALSINAPAAVDAKFTRRQFTLTVATSGSGSVSSTPEGITCGTACTMVNIPYGNTVTLTAMPATGFALSGWSGGGCGTANPCVVTVTAATTVTATFATAQYPLVVTKTGVGTVTADVGGINCGATCSSTYAHGSNVVLSAEPGNGYTFGGWFSSACSGRGYCILSMSAATAVTAKFVFPLSCSYSDKGTCSMVAWEAAVGTNLDSTACRTECGIRLAAEGKTRGCWAISSSTCYCRDGVENTSTYLGPVGSCE